MAVVKEFENIYQEMVNMSQNNAKESKYTYI